LNETVVTQIEDLNKKKPDPKPTIPEPNIPDPNEWTEEQIEEAKLVGANIEPKPEIPPELLATTMPKPESYDLTMLPGFVEIIPESKQKQEKRKLAPSAVATLTFRDAKMAKKLFEAIHAITDEVLIKFEPDKICIRQMDPSRVCMIDFNIEKQYFEEWHVLNPGVACFNIDEVLKVVFSKLKKDTYLTITINKPERGKITFTLKDNRERQRTFYLLDVEESDQRLDTPAPKLNYNALYKLVTKQFHEDLLDMQKVTDHVKLFGYMDKLVMKAEGDTVKGETKYERGSDTLLNIETREESKATYSQSYLTDVCVNPNLCDIMTLELTTDMPLRATIHSPFGDLYTYLAPRIETED
jgi:proliferating cell nuclear antigen